jgi:hypothetical protein
MRDQKSNLPVKQPSKPFQLEDEDNRIDWDRKSQKKKRHEPEDLLDEVSELLLIGDELDEAAAPNPKKTKAARQGKQGNRDKRRQLVMDETSGQVRVNRRRKTNRNLFDAWLDEYE